MENRIIILTLGVDDLDYMTNWYKEMFGWTPIRKGSSSVFYKLHGLMLALIPENQLSRDFCLWEEDRGSSKFALTVGFRSEKDLDKKFHEIRNKGVVVIREPGKSFDGIYKGSISDPEGNFWELAFYPLLDIDNATERFSISERVYHS